MLGGGPARPRAIERIVIVGGGVAAQRCAFALRDLGHMGEITMLSRESEPPYDRTLLSKSMLTGEQGTALPLRPLSSYVERDITLRLGVVAEHIDAKRSEVVCANGLRVSYDKLIIATGGAALVPPTFQVPGVHTLRELSDLAALRAELSTARRLVIVGGGFIGSELASSALALGLDVSVLEGAPTPLALALGEVVGRHVADLQRANGVDLHTGVAVSAVDRASRSWRVHLADGRALTSDVVVLALGMRASVGWLHGSGLQLAGGIQTDPYCGTGVPDVFAAGDCARWRSRRFGIPMHAGHWDVAAKHGEAAAANALGEPCVFDPVPFFWSDQHGRKLAMAGSTSGWDDVTIDEDDGAGGFTASYRRAGELTAMFSTIDVRRVARTHRALAGLEREADSVVSAPVSFSSAAQATTKEHDRP